MLLTGQWLDMTLEFNAEINEESMTVMPNVTCFVAQNTPPQYKLYGNIGLARVPDSFAKYSFL